MKFGNWKRLKEIAQKAAQVASKGARIGGKIINYARPLIDTAADFIPGGAVIKKGVEYIDKFADPLSKGLERMSKGENVVKTIKDEMNSYVKKNPSDSVKRINNFIQNNVPENLFGKPVNQDFEDDNDEDDKLFED